METLREQAKNNAIKMIKNNLDRYNELTHLSHNHIWLEVYPDGKCNEAEEVDRNTSHWIDYPDKAVATIYTIANCEFCDCDACVSWRDAHDEDMSDKEFAAKWGYDRLEVSDTDFAQHLKDYESYIDPTDDVLSAIDDIEHGYFSDEQ